jgi:hypothetical protein
MGLIAVLLIFIFGQLLSFFSGVFLGWTLHLSKEQGDQLADADDHIEQTEQYMIDEGYLMEEI